MGWKTNKKGVLFPDIGVGSFVVDVILRPEYPIVSPDRYPLSVPAPRQACIASGGDLRWEAACRPHSADWMIRWCFTSRKRRHSLLPVYVLYLEIIQAILECPHFVRH